MRAKFALLSGVVLLLSLAGGWLLLGGHDRAAPGDAFPAPASTDQPITPIPARLQLDARKVSLGRKLFHDPRLSHDNSLSCASCHDLKKAGADGRKVALGINGTPGTLNSPTVFNSGFNFRQFWDGRAATLEEQAEGPVHNPIEMASNWKEVVAKLKADAALVVQFRAIWPEGIRPDHIQNAIAEFERSLVTPDSAYDRYLGGDQNALSADAREGAGLFRNLGCIACHQGVNLGGNMYAGLGIMGNFFADRGLPPGKSDQGRFNVTGREEDRHVFKVPTLRNIALTAPYYHDGSVATLDKAVRAMARYQLGVELNDRDTEQLLAFLRSLTGEYREAAR